jgi:hypothetical protein
MVNTQTKTSNSLTPFMKTPEGVGILGIGKHLSMPSIFPGANSGIAITYCTDVNCDYELDAIRGLIYNDISRSDERSNYVS